MPSMPVHKTQWLYIFHLLFPFSVFIFKTLYKDLN